jgi:hypothetical protein
MRDRHQATHDLDSNEQRAPTGDRLQIEMPTAAPRLDPASARIMLHLLERLRPAARHPANTDRAE